MAMIQRSLILCVLLGLSAIRVQCAEAARSMKFKATTVDEARKWQQQARAQLYISMMGGHKPDRPALEPKLGTRIPIPTGSSTLQEISFQSLPGRRTTAWISIPSQPKGRLGAVLAIHGHGGRAEQIVRGDGLYWYGRALAEMGYVVISPEVGSHETRYPGWSLMGERVWDALRCVDYLATLPFVDTNRIAVAGLSLGGETTMYVAALDERLKAVDASGWLTTVANMKNGHCPCWNFPGLEEHFDFSDIFACIAPRPLICEVGERERAPGGFPVPIARKAFEEIKTAYAVFGSSDKAQLTVHAAGHVFKGYDAWPVFENVLGKAWPWQPVGAATSTEELLRRGELARRCFIRATGVLESWWRTRDASTGLFPRRLNENVWAPQDNAADMLPFHMITAELLVPSRAPEVHHVLRTERSLTSRLGPLPDFYDLTNHCFLHANPDITRILFGAAEYCKDGLVPMTEMLGKGPWVERFRELMDAIIDRAPIASSHGNLPANDSEVNGDVLQAVCRLYALTREPRYLELAARIGDAYCLEVLPNSGFLPPHRWDFQNHRVILDELNLNDHGNELIGGLAELYTLASRSLPRKAEAWRPALFSMFQRLLNKARNGDGFWFNRVKASTGEVISQETPDTWGYALAACLTFGRATQEETLMDAPRLALKNLAKPRYLDWDGADSYADSIEGCLLLLNRIPEPEGFAWLERILPIFLGKQRDDGIVEGWYGDGNYSRTAIMLGQYFTQGARCRPWRPDLRLGAVRDGNRVLLAVSSETPWEGRVLFDIERHRAHFRLPSNYPRLNEFPEWFTVDPDKVYKVRMGKTTREGRGFDLSQGLPVSVQPKQAVLIEISSK